MCVFVCVYVYTYTYIRTYVRMYIHTYIYDSSIKKKIGSRQLLARGMHVPAIRPPTVQVGMSRLRVALSAAHSEQDIEALALALRDTGVLSLAAHFAQAAQAKL